MVDEPNTQTLAKIAEETSALVLRGQLRYPGPVHSALVRDADANTGDREISTENIPDVLYPCRDRKVLLILAPIVGGNLRGTPGSWRWLRDR